MLFGLFYEQVTTYGHAYHLRNGLLVVALLMAVETAAGLIDGAAVFALLGVLLLSTAVIGRALFYVLVIPTTMPGAFFWKNQDFVTSLKDSCDLHHQW